jgi:hypothetical protein
MGQGEIGLSRKASLTCTVKPMLVEAAGAMVHQRGDWHEIQAQHGDGGYSRWVPSLKTRRWPPRNIGFHFDLGQ